MNKYDNIHTLFNILNGCLSYAYDMTLRDNETTIVLTKGDIDTIMYIYSNECRENDFVGVINYDGSDEIFDGENDTVLWTSEDGQIPLSDILSDIKYYL
ncbi:MAG: hypothetical protein [Bacteriophage sp.]|nr:MAG: hypothetical protein [Bacteriophage sp.]